MLMCVGYCCRGCYGRGVFLGWVYLFIGWCCLFCVVYCWGKVEGGGWFLGGGFVGFVIFVFRWGGGGGLFDLWG